jgi:hypothetical protein
VRCTNCDYPLWNTAARACPECGKAFQPSQYRFRPGSVAFRCPGCRTAYYGVSAEGHLIPREFACVTCGAHCAMDAMALEPAAGFDDEATRGDPPNPWMQRHRNGLFRSWLRSVFQVMGAPQRFIRGVPAESPVAEAILFAVITATVAAVIGLVFLVVFMPLLLLVPGAAGGGAGITRLIALQLGVVVANVLFSVVASVIAGFCAHLFLLVMRSAPGGLGRSMQATLYASGGANAISIIPCPCSGFILPVWWCVVNARMLQVVHGTRGPAAWIASILAAIVWAGTAFGLAFTLQSAMGMNNQAFTFTIPPRPAPNAPPPIAVPAAALSFFDPDSLPISPLDALAEKQLDSDEFVELLGLAEPEIPILGLTEETLTFGPERAIRDASRRLARILPPGDAAFRLGRAVFVYRDAPPGTEAWLVVRAPEPGATGDERRYRVVTRLLDEVLDEQHFAARLSAENARRAAAGRPPIPADLDSVPDLLVAPVTP